MSSGETERPDGVDMTAARMCLSSVACVAGEGQQTTEEMGKLFIRR
jgi:hypothetical protein